MVRSDSITGGSVSRVSTSAGAKWRRLSQQMADDAAGPLSPQMAAARLPQEMLHEDEVVLILTKPSLWFVMVTSFRFMLTVALLGVLAVKLLQWQVNPQIIGGTTAVVCLARLVWAMLVWTSHTYMLTNQRVVTIKGVLNTTMFQAHLRKIQRTVLYQPLYLRILSIGTVGFATAATTDFDSTWVMVGRPLQTHEAIVAAIQKLQ